MSRHVRGSFFSEYVRMLRRSKGVDWATVLPASDLPLLHERVDAERWYPMETFERFGLAILKHVSGATLDAVRFWGRFSANQYASEHPQLIAAGEPLETLMRLKVLRATLFDFPAFDMPMLTDGHAYVVMSYQMSAVAEEAASHQTLGFCEGILALAGAEDVKASFIERSWAGDACTRAEFEWRSP